MIQYIRDAAIRVCERTLLWRYAQPTFSLLPGVHEYAYDKPANTEVHVLFDAMVNDRPLAKLTLEQALYQYPEWADLYSGEDPSVVWSLTPPGTFDESQYNEALFNPGSLFVLPAAVVAKASEPRSITQLTPDKYVVLPLPDNEKTYTTRMIYALKPTRDANDMDEAVFNELEEAILHSALQYLLVLPDVAWSDRELAAYHAKQFLREMTERRARANLGNMRGTMRATAPKFA
jgi:2-oxo-4-hydroxy-4-carboxy--5-ureidoimidazoline (OHCU) decarboxylase